MVTGSHNIVDAAPLVLLAWPTPCCQGNNNEPGQIRSSATTVSDRAARITRDGVDCMLSAWHGRDAFDMAIAEDPGLRWRISGAPGWHQLNMESGKARAMAAQPVNDAARPLARKAMSISWPP